MSDRAVAGSAQAARKRLPSWDWLWQLAFLAVHIPVALTITKYSPYAPWYARFVLGVGVVLALTSRRWERVACVGAYIAGAEVFWRMRRADIPWEFGKYSLALIFLIALVRFGRLPRNGLAIAYFFLLLPSAILTYLSVDAAEARDQLSFNLSGPLALTLSVLFFSAVRLTRAEMRWVYVCLLAPIVSIAVVAAVTLELYMPDEFQAASSAVASGGYGPNQVSAVLGLGILAAVLYMILGAGSAVATAAFAILALFLFRQCAITFSRGGLYMSVGGLVASAFYLSRDKRTRLRLLGGLAIFLPLLFLVVWPRLETLTGGAIGSRFKSIDSTGRALLVEADLKTWSENPVLGSGPGLGGKNRLRVFRVTTAHTEYTRLVAEHGIFGLAALALLLFLGVTNVRAAPTRVEKALAAGMVAYSLLSMAVDGMRLASAAFAFGLSAVRFSGPRRARVAAPRGAPLGRPFAEGGQAR